MLINVCAVNNQNNIMKKLFDRKENFAVENSRIFLVGRGKFYSKCLCYVTKSYDHVFYITFFVSFIIFCVLK